MNEQATLLRQWMLIKLKYVDQVSGAFHETSFGLSDYSRHSEILDALLVGMEDRRVVWITYRSQRSTEAVTYDVHPYRFTRHLGSLYLMGYKPQDEQLRTWRVDRIEAAQVDAVPFMVPPDLHLDARLAGSFGIYDGGEQQQPVRIRFSPAAARYVQEKQWHPSQQFTPQRDGSLIVDFRLSSTVEVKSWVLSFGRDAEVLEPKALRAEITEELEQLRACYPSSPARRKSPVLAATSARARRRSPDLAETADRRSPSTPEEHGP